MKKFVYKGIKSREISFPLGGIGTGCIGLSGNGSLIDWEIFNRPNKGSRNGMSFFAIKAECGGKAMDARVLNGDVCPPYSGRYGSEKFTGYGHGVDRATLAGVPHFKDIRFIGEYPVAELKYKDDTFPGKVKMTAFNPFIPLNNKDSSIAGAFFEIEVKNTAGKEINYSICLAMTNPLDTDGSYNKYDEKPKDIHTITFGSESYKKTDTEYGDVTIATDAKDISCQEYWYRGTWFDSLTVFWKDFTANGKLRNRKYSEPHERADAGVLSAHIDVMPGERKKVRFVITWSFPNMYNYWDRKKHACGPDGGISRDTVTWKNYYASMFENSAESAVYSLNNWKRLYAETKEFKKALFSSTLPPEVLDAVSANISILKSPTCLRLEDGSFYGFEGCHCTEGSCEGSCTHVWNYAYALPFLFPGLERSMRDLDFKYNQDENGEMSFRLKLPLGSERSKFRPCADGQFGGVVKMYRDWKISGDSEWLKSHWESIKKSIDFAWDKTNRDMWDSDKDGVLEGRQHHTLDMELFGPNSWLTGFYLAALKAGAEMAEHFGEVDKAKEYSALFYKGKAWVDENLYNGKYYFQKIDISDASILKKYFIDDEQIMGGKKDVIETYWDNESQEIKYQIAHGCGIDQVLAQWHSDICSLGDIFDREKTNNALKSIFKYNFKSSFREWFNPCRLYSLNDEAGAVLISWPEGESKPTIPAPYAEETWSGCEYQFASHMIRRGFLDEGLTIVKAVRDRYDGEKRNPWNEFECGSNYARSMSSFDLLLAFSGFEFDMVNGMIGFDPVQMKNGKFKCFWSLDAGWGTISIEPNSIKLCVVYGDLKIKKLKLPFIDKALIKSIKAGNKNIDYSASGDFISFGNKIEIKKGESLSIYSQ